MQKVVVADRMQDQPFGVGQHDHALRIDDLLAQRLHDRHRMRAQHLVLLALQREASVGQDVVIRPERCAQAERLGAFVRFLDRLGRPRFGAVSRRRADRMNVVAHCLLLNAPGSCQTL
ncbi:hypothetical protein [Paraburkholderia youngii]|uniref:hypothetical protein n=1 Tax=Paraburkholderia youngii TaxID=2782701 RepID=UPI003D1954A0